VANTAKHKTSDTIQRVTGRERVSTSQHEHMMRWTKRYAARPPHAVARARSAAFHSIRKACNEARRRTLWRPRARYVPPTYDGRGIAQYTQAHRVLVLTRTHDATHWHVTGGADWIGSHRIARRRTAERRLLRALAHLSALSLQAAHPLLSPLGTQQHTVKNTTDDATQQATRRESPLISEYSNEDEAAAQPAHSTRSGTDWQHMTSAHDHVEERK